MSAKDSFTNGMNIAVYSFLSGSVSVMQKNALCTVMFCWCHVIKTSHRCR